MTSAPTTISLSASKIDTYLDCPLKWYWAYVVGLPTIDTPAKELGTTVHGLCENYLRDGKQPHDGKPGIILRAGLHLLPPVGSVRVEEWLRLGNIGAHPLWTKGIHEGIVTPEWEDDLAAHELARVYGADARSLAAEPYLSGAKLNGKIDMHHPRLSEVQGILEPRDHRILEKVGLHVGGLLYVGDLKTTSSFEYAKTPEQLAINPQMNIYAYGIGVQAYEREGVRWDTKTGAPQGALVEHVAVRTKGQPMGKRERAFMRWDQIEKNMASVDATSRAMLKLSCKGEAEVRDNPLNAKPSACSKYGGCPFQEFCPHSPIGRQRGRALMPAMTVGPVSAKPTTTGVRTMTKANSNKSALFGDKGAQAPATASAGKGATAASAGKGAAAGKARTPTKGTGVGAKAPTATASAGKGAQGAASPSKGAKAAVKVGKVGTVEKGAGSALNPPDAAASQPPVEAEKGVVLILENIDLNDGKLALAFAKKLIAKLGCDFDEVVAAGGFVIEDDTLYPAAEAGESVGEGEVPVGEDGIPLDGEGNPCYAINEHKPGQWRAYTPDGTAITDTETGAFAFASWDDANTAAWKATLGETEVAVEGGVEVEVQGEPAAEEEPAVGTDYTQTDAYAQVDAQAKVTIDALWEALSQSETGTLDEAQVNEVVKTACKVKRLHNKTRDPILAAGVEMGAFQYHGDGLAFVGTPEGEFEPQGEEVAAQGEEPEGVPETEVVQPVGLEGPGLVVLVDALAVGQHINDLAAYLAPFEDEVAKQGLDVRGKGADYCKGGKAVASRLLISCLSEPLTGWWAISSRHSYVEEVLSVLVRSGAVVVRGVR